MAAKKTTVRKTNLKIKAESTDNAPSVNAETAATEGETHQVTETENVKAVETAKKSETKKKPVRREEDLPIYLL